MEYVKIEEEIMVVVKFLMIYFLTKIAIFKVLSTFFKSLTLFGIRQPMTDNNNDAEVTIKIEDIKKEEDTADMKDINGNHNLHEASSVWEASLSQLQSGAGKSKTIDKSVRKTIKSIVEFLASENQSKEADTLHENATKNRRLKKKTRMVVDELEGTKLNGLSIPVIVEMSSRMIVVYRKQDIILNTEETTSK